MGKRLLVISHNLIDMSNNVGKTIISMLKEWPSSEIYSIYFRNEIRKPMYCMSSYMITDKDILKNLFFKTTICGRTVNIEEEREEMVADKAAYRFGNKRYPIVSLIRDDIWHFKRWKTREFDGWIKSVRPDLILFIPNDYVLAFEVAEYVRDLVDKPIVTFFTDDAFYHGQRIHGIEQIRRKRLREIGARMIVESSFVFTASEMMKEEYKAIYGKDSVVIGNCVEISARVSRKEWSEADEIIFSYIGNLHSNRWTSLVELGRCLSRIKEEKKLPLILNVYTASDLPAKIKEKLIRIPVLCMKGALPPNQVKNVQEHSDALIHIEAFDEKSKMSARLSMSTKIFEYMARGVPVFAYGPEDVASVRFLEENKFAAVCKSSADLAGSLKNFINHESIRNEMSEKAYAYAKIHFEEHIISSKFCGILSCQ